MKRVFIFLLTFSLIFASAGCKKNAPADTGSGFEEMNTDISYGGSVQAYILRPDTFNPLTTGISSNRRILSLCFDSLFTLDSGFNLVPRLAESYSVSDGGKKIRIHLRQDVTWHDGSKFTASDVIYTVNNIVSSDNSYYRSVLDGLISRVRTVDSYTVDFYLNYPNNGAVAHLVFPIIKKGTGFSEGYSPIGTGPFRLKGGLTESSVILEKNPDWKCGEVYIDSVVLNVLPDENAVYSAFSTGVIDFVQITKDNAGKFSISENIGYIPTYSYKYTFVGLNFENSLLASDDVRKTISNLLNTETFTHSVLSDYGIATNLPIHPMAYYYNPEKPSFDSPFVVKEEGLLYYRTPSENIPLEFTLLVNEENTARCTVAEHLAAVLGEHGISVKVLFADYETYKKRISDGDFDMYLGTTQLSSDANLHPIVGNEGNLNYGKFYNDSVETLLNNLLTCENPSYRSEILKKLQLELYNTVPHIPLYFENEMIVYNSKKISNVHPVPSGNISEFLSMCCVNE